MRLVMADSDEALLDDFDVETDVETEEIEEELELEPEAEAEDESEDDELVVTIGEDSPPPEETTPAPDWVRDLRKQYREEKKRSKELEKKLETLTKGDEKKATTLPQKPTLELADYDTEQYENMLTDWYEKKRKYETEQQAVQQKEQEAQQEWQGKLDSYEDRQIKVKGPRLRGC
jgi:hypothetical protein